MYCRNCGCDNVEGAKFCRGCGTPLNLEVNENNNVGQDHSTDVESHNEAQYTFQNAQGAASSAGTGNPTPGASVGANPIPHAAPSGKPKIPVVAFIAAGIAAFVLILGLVFFVTTRNRINLNKYVKIEATGYDGYGRAKADLDWNAITKKYGNRIKFKKNMEPFAAYSNPVEMLIDGVYIELSDYDELKNGDKIEYKINVQPELENVVKCKLKHKPGTYKVKNLQHVKKFDAFKKVEVEFTGTSPEGHANINYTGKELNVYNFNFDKSSGLSNGDTVKLTIDKNCIEFCASEHGMVPEKLTKEYKVKGLESYLSQLSQISKDSLAEVQAQAKDVFDSSMAKRNDEGEKINAFEYIGNYLLTLKDSDSWYSENKLYLVYQVKVQNTFAGDDGTYDQENVFYWYIRYDSVKVNDEGKLNLDLSNYDTPYHSARFESNVSDRWWTKSWSYRGYNTVDELYKDVVTSQVDRYNHEDNVDATKPVAVAETTPKTKPEGGYVLKDSGTKKLSKSDLEGFTAEQCKIARNEIYARHGRKFKDAALQEYFNACPWYKGTVEADAFDEKLLSDIEIANKDLIVEFEKEKGYR